MKKVYKTMQEKTIATEQRELTNLFLKYILISSPALAHHLDSPELLLIKDIIRVQNERFSRKSVLTQIKNICPFTGRSRGFYNFSGMSRLEFKYLSSLGKIPGIRKAS